MRETDERAVTFDDPRRDGGLERVCGDSRLLEQRLRRRADGGRDREGLLRPGGKRFEPRAHELVERLRDRKRPQRFDVSGKDARDLEREERVPAGAFVDAEQRLPWKRRSRVDRAGTDGARPHSAGRRPRAARRSPPSACSSSDCRVSSPSRLASRTVTALESSRRRAKASACDDAGSSHWTSSIATSVGCDARSAAAARRELQPRPCGSRQGRPSPPLGAGQPRARAARGAGRSGSTSSTIGSKRSPRPTYASPRSGSEGRDDSTCKPSRARELDRVEPQRRLPDAGLALEDERLRPIRLVTVDEGTKGGELGVPADDLGNHRHVKSVTDPTIKPKSAASGVSTDAVHVTGSRSGRRWPLTASVPGSAVVPGASCGPPSLRPRERLPRRRSDPVSRRRSRTGITFAWNGDGQSRRWSACRRTAPAASGSTRRGRHPMTHLVPDSTTTWTVVRAGRQGQPFGEQNAVRRRARRR